MKYQNVVIGNLLLPPHYLFAFNEIDWNENEEKQTLFTTETFLPKIMVMCGMVKSISEVRRNKPELCINLNSYDFLKIKWGKKYLWIGVGNISE